MTKIAPNRTSEFLAVLIGEPEKNHRVEVCEKIAKRLNRIAHKAEYPWTWRYVLSVRMGTVAPSEKFANAVDELYCPTPKKAPLHPKWLRVVKRRIAKMAKQTRQDLGLQK